MREAFSGWRNVVRTRKLAWARVVKGINRVADDGLAVQLPLGDHGDVLAMFEALKVKGVSYIDMVETIAVPSTVSSFREWRLRGIAPSRDFGIEVCRRIDSAWRKSVEVEYVRMHMNRTCDPDVEEYLRREHEETMFRRIDIVVDEAVSDIVRERAFHSRRAFESRDRELRRDIYDIDQKLESLLKQRNTIEIAMQEIDILLGDPIVHERSIRLAHARDWAGIIDIIEHHHDNVIGEIPGPDVVHEIPGPRYDPILPRPGRKRRNRRS